jgi:hypothetical protein
MKAPVRIRTRIKMIRKRESASIPLQSAVDVRFSGYLITIAARKITFLQLKTRILVPFRGIEGCETSAKHGTR